MSDNSSNNKRIAVNTVILYAKLIINIVVSFVAARLVLNALGASDYGLYNVVGGIVAMLNTIGTSMVATSYRYMAVELGKKEEGNPNKVYNTVFIIHLFLALLLLVLGETIGVYYINHYLNVDPNKIPDALFVLHLSLLTTAFAVITVPTNGLIIAREEFLFTSIVETISALLKIGFVIALIHMEGNKLRLYAIFLAICQFIIPLCYQIYCRLTDREIIRWKVNKNWQDYKDVFSFAIWILFGAMAVVGKNQGAALIINSFFGTVLNAAFGLANQVSYAFGQFTSNLRQAFIPQIMKNQNSNEERSINLVYAISRYSYLTMNIFAIPLLLCMRGVLELWLGTPPEYTEVFVDFMLISGMISNLGAGFDASIQATGKVRKNQIGYSIINLMLLPIIFVLFKVGFPPYINVVVMVFLSIITLIFQIWIMTGLTSFDVKTYIQLTIIPSLNSTAVAFIPLYILHLIIPESTIWVLVFLVIAVIWTVFSLYIYGISRSEKQMVASIVKSKLINSRKHK